MIEEKKLSNEKIEIIVFSESPIEKKFCDSLKMVFSKNFFRTEVDDVFFLSFQGFVKFMNVKKKSKKIFKNFFEK